MSQFYKELLSSPGQAFHPLCKRYVVILPNFFLVKFRLLIELLIQDLFTSHLLSFQPFLYSTVHYR